MLILGFAPHGRLPGFVPRGVVLGCPQPLDGLVEPPLERAHPERPLVAALRAPVLVLAPTLGALRPCHLAQLPPGAAGLRGAPRHPLGLVARHAPRRGHPLGVGRLEPALGCLLACLQQLNLRQLLGLVALLLVVTPLRGVLRPAQLARFPSSLGLHAELLPTLAPGQLPITGRQPLESAFVEKRDERRDHFVGRLARSAVETAPAQRLLVAQFAATPLLLAAEGPQLAPEPLALVEPWPLGRPWSWEQPWPLEQT